MRGPLQGFVGEGLAIIDRSAALPKVKTAKLLAEFERGRLRWSRVWQFVVLGHWLKNNLTRQLAPECAGETTTIK